VSTSTSPSLLLRIRNSDDTGAWQEFVDLYSPIVRGYCFQRELQHSDTDDIVQDVFAGVSTAIRQFEYDPSKGKFRSWFGTIVANRIRNHLARQSIRQVQSIDQQQHFDSEIRVGPTPQRYSDPDSAWVELFSERVFRVACSRIRMEFSDVQWNCFEATWVRAENASDVAKAMRIPIHQIYVNKSRVLKRLEAEVRLLAEELPLSDSLVNDEEHSI